MPLEAYPQPEFALLNDNEPLWRYMRMSTFERFIKNRELYFTRADLFHDDAYEAELLWRSPALLGGSIVDYRIHMNSVDFAAFREQWLEDIRARNPSTTQVGQRFAHKLFTQWRDVTDASDDLVYCDGPSDGGIDLAFLERGEQDGENLTGDTWYVVQSKYGTSFQGPSTLLVDGQKVIDTLDSNKTPAANVSATVVARIRQFLLKADTEPSGDRLILVFATEMPLNETERRTLEDVRAVGRARFGKVFDVEAVSIETIYINQAEDPLNAISPPIQVPIEATMATSGRDLIVGSIPLLKLYEFLKAYRAQTENLDQLYEKNVRRFLGGVEKLTRECRQP